MLVLPVIGALAGGFGAPWIAARLADVTPLDPARWTVIVPGRDERAVTELSTTGTVDGALRVAEQAFGRVDTLVPRVEGDVTAVTVEVARGSAPIAVSFRGADGRVWRAAEVAAEGWRAGPQDGWRPYAAPLRIEARDGRAIVGGEPAGTASPGALELSPVSGVGRLRAVRVEAGGTTLDQRFDAPPAGPLPYVAGLVAGALLGAASALTARRGAVVAALLGLVLPLLVLLPSYDTWDTLRAHLHLPAVSPLTLRRAALALAALPALAGALVSSGLLELPDAADLPPSGSADHPASPSSRASARLALRISLRLAAALLLTDLLALRGLPPVAWLAGLPGLVFLALPAWTAHRAGLDPTRATLRDAPALLAVAALGWPLGLLPAVAWRLLCAWADAPAMLGRAARAGVDALFLHLLCLPLAGELALREADVAWSPEQLAGASSHGGTFAPFWEASCGDPAPALYLFGGSSAGGAYQFTGEPEAFFVARLHAGLCAAGQPLRTLNFGNSGRDTWDMAQESPRLFAAAPPAVVIVYAGVNDLLTRNAPYTRKQQAARVAAARAGVGPLASLVGRSRLLTGLSLLLRPPETSPELVIAVPLPDAEENLRAVAAATTAAGGQLLLVPEYVQPAMRGPMAPYVEMERRLADELDGVTFVDVAPALDALPPDEVLADRNHLTRRGSGIVADVLAPVVRAILAPG